MATATRRPRLRLQEIQDIPELSAEEARASFDLQVREALGISGDEFIRRWEAGEYAEGEEDPRITGLALVISWGKA